MKEKDCEVCFQIKCKNCGWEPDNLQLDLVIKGSLICCPECGWAPNSVRII